jgi:hypothetical protein
MEEIKEFPVRRRSNGAPVARRRLATGLPGCIYRGDRQRLILQKIEIRA